MSQSFCLRWADQSVVIFEVVFDVILRSFDIVFKNSSNSLNQVFKNSWRNLKVLKVVLK